MPNVRELTERKGYGWARAATHCVHGHAFDEANTIWEETGWRRCKACLRRMQRNWLERKRAQG